MSLINKVYRCKYTKIWLYISEITDCYNLGNIETNTGNTGGGIVGYTVNSIEYCYNKGEISLSRGSAGGIAGYIDGATLSFCYNMGKAFRAGKCRNSYQRVEVRRGERWTDVPGVPAMKK